MVEAVNTLSIPGTLHLLLQSLQALLCTAVLTCHVRCCPAVCVCVCAHTYTQTYVLANMHSQHANTCVSLCCHQTWVQTAAAPGTEAVSLAAVNSVGKAGGLLGPLSFGLILSATGEPDDGGRTHIYMCTHHLRLLFVGILHVSLS